MIQVHQREIEIRFKQKKEVEIPVIEIDNIRTKWKFEN